MVVAVRVQIVRPNRRGRMLLVMELRLKDFFLEMWNGLGEDPIVVVVSAAMLLLLL